MRAFKGRKKWTDGRIPIFREERALSLRFGSRDDDLNLPSSHFYTYGWGNILYCAVPQLDPLSSVYLKQ